MDDHLKENFGEVKAKDSSEEALQRGRRMPWLGKNWEQGFGFMPNLSKRSEAHAIHRTTAGLRDYRVPENVNAADELESIVEGQDEKKPRGHGGVEGTADKLLTSAESPSRGIWFFDSEALQGMTYLVLWSKYAVCAFVSLIVGIMIERWSKCALDGLVIGASILLVVFVSANGDYKQSLHSKDLHAQQKKIAVPVTRNGFRQELSIHDLRPGVIVPLNVGDQVPADGLFITGGSLLINESSLTGDSRPDNASGVGIPFLLSGTEAQFWIMQDACDPRSSDSRHLLIACPSDDCNDLILQAIHDLDSGCLDKQKQAALKIRFLTKNKPENRFRITQAGAIKPLITLISSSDPEAQEYGVTAILNLSLCDKNKKLIAASGSIEPLVKALGTGTSTAKENAACALLHLSKIEENKVAIGQLGAIPLLVSLLESRGLQGKKDASAALYSLCFAGENKVRAVQAGAMRPLVELMANLGSSMVDKAAGVVIRLMGAAEAKATLVAERGIPVLVKIVGDGTQRRKRLAVEVLLRLCKDSVAYQTMVVQAGAMRLLVGLMSDLGSSMADKAAGMVSMLVGAAEARPALVEEGGIPVLVKMAEVGTQSQKEIAVVVLFQLCKESVACRTTVVQAGAMRPLVELMADLGSSIVDKAADVVSTLVGAVGAAEARAALAMERGIRVLVNMVGLGTQRQKRIAMEVLLQLCEDSFAYRAMVMQEGAMRLLVELMADPRSSMVDKAAGVVSTLISVAEARAALVEEGGIPVLVKIVKEGTQTQKEIVVEVLLRLCEKSAAYRSMVVQEKAIRPLAALSKSGTYRGKQKAETLRLLLQRPRSGNAAATTQRY